MNNYILNPFLSVREFEVDGQLLNLQTIAPKKNGHLIIESFSKNNDLQVFNNLKKLINGHAFENFDDISINKFLASNIVIESENISQYNKYRCEVDKAFYQIKHESLVFNPNVIIGKIPQDLIDGSLNQSFFDGIEVNDKTVWVKDYLSKIWWPYQLKIKDIEALLQNNLSGFDEKQKSLFFEIGILLNKNFQEIRNETILRMKQKYIENTSIHIKGLFNKHVLKALKNYYDNLEEQGFLRLGDFQTWNRYWAHNDNMNRFVQSQIHGYISEIVGQDWRPAFTYYVSYKSESSLKKHVDRSQASLSLSILIDFGDSTGSKPDEWPFYIEKNIGSDEYFEYLIGQGNAGLFLGNDYVHYRLPLKKDHYSMSMLMHFIPAGYKGKVL